MDSLDTLTLNDNNDPETLRAVIGLGRNRPTRLCSGGLIRAGNHDAQTATAYRSTLTAVRGSFRNWRTLGGFAHWTTSSAFQHACPGHHSYRQNDSFRRSGGKLESYEVAAGDLGACLQRGRHSRHDPYISPDAHRSECTVTGLSIPATADRRALPGMLPELHAVLRFGDAAAQPSRCRGRLCVWRRSVGDSPRGRRWRRWVRLRSTGAHSHPATARRLIRSRRWRCREPVRRPQAAVTHIGLMGTNYSVSADASAFCSRSQSRPSREAAEVHEVEAGDAGFGFAVPGATVTRLPLPDTHSVEAGDAAFGFDGLPLAHDNERAAGRSRRSMPARSGTTSTYQPRPLPGSVPPTLTRSTPATSGSRLRSPEPTITRGMLPPQILLMSTISMPETWGSRGTLRHSYQPHFGPSSLWRRNRPLACAPLIRAGNLARRNGMAFERCRSPGAARNWRTSAGSAGLRGRQHAVPDHEVPMQFGLVPDGTPGYAQRRAGDGFGFETHGDRDVHAVICRRSGTFASPDRSQTSLWSTPATATL